ncbi:MAG: c-type cytochrome, partial [Alphaproteobacteria bacterium]
MNRHLGLLVLAIGLPIASGPAYSGDAETGHVLAQTWCSHCHIVEADQKQAIDAAPPFAQIANDPSKSASGIAVWLADPHPPMPN